jgi:ribose 1,5-bisphosphokinase PhnN
MKRKNLILGREEGIAVLAKVLPSRGTEQNESILKKCKKNKHFST